MFFFSFSLFVKARKYNQIYSSHFEVEQKKIVLFALILLLVSFKQEKKLSIGVKKLVKLEKDITEEDKQKLK